MNTFLDRKLDRLSSTSALGAMGNFKTNPVTYSRTLIAPSTSTSITNVQGYLLAALDMTTSGVTLPSISSTEVTQKALNELRRLSGLTWEQLAKLFNVSRRSLHFWASGQPLNSFNEEHLNRLLDAIKYINRGSASLNRNVLFTNSSDGTLPFDLLVAGKYEEVKRIVGVGNAPPRPQLKPLSEDARASRRPLNPADLVDALQEPIHREVGRSKPARSVRSRKNSSGK
ncbi:helix-turn-helix domain-containing protein [Merismopedia glauca]|uniref:Transcriptional regulator n=1 Tax=Merismopedia glauca CCAP 1448/3 TaxID=1296344 RepID=A0A2T1C687_9CYAN|nr:helix-turn-helix transcriptional regulator [Merismopedia glauca]PSB03653.1 transcriptional regulator [Merismopedia glauca CCAP 1448/3]